MCLDATCTNIYCYQHFIFILKHIKLQRISKMLIINYKQDRRMQSINKNSFALQKNYRTILFTELGRFKHCICGLGIF